MATKAYCDDPASGWREKVSAALKEALAALPKDQWQPWKVHIEDRLVELSVGEEKRGEIIDPEGREVIIRCGLVLQTFKYFLKRHGCLGRVRLFPELDKAALVARIRVCECGESKEPLDGGFEAMEPASERGDYASISPNSWTTLNWIQKVAGSERCWLDIARCQTSRNYLVSLARMNRHWTFKVLESREMPERTPSGSRLGPGRFKVWQRFSQGLRLRLSIAASADVNEPDPSSTSDTFAVLKTKTDDKWGWIAAGETTAMLLQTAGQLGVLCKFFDDGMRSASVRRESRTSIGHKGFGQAVVQLHIPNQAAFSGASSAIAAVGQSDRRGHSRGTGRP